MVGLGTQDTLSDAGDFVRDRKTTFRMLWDASFQSWRQLKIPGQPAAILFAADGSEIKRWQGRFPEDEVVRLAEANR